MRADFRWTQAPRWRRPAASYSPGPQTPPAPRKVLT
jgi:hypothetical protein